MMHSAPSPSASGAVTPCGKTVGFIGAGTMATAMACRFADAGVVERASLVLFDVVPAAAARLAEQTGGTAVDSVGTLVSRSDIVIFSVKPHQIGDLLDREIAPLVSSAACVTNKVFLTIAAGLPMEVYARAIAGDATRVVRAMPNTPTLVGEGVSAYCCSEAVSEADRGVVHALLASMGPAFCVPESQMDAVTGLSGSGPAYMFLLLDALAAGGVQQGLPRAVALTLAAQTMRGAATMVLESGEHPAVLLDRVTTPGGTTIAGLAAMERLGVRAAMIAAVNEATQRSVALGKKT